MVPRIRIFASVTSVPFAIVSFETSQPYSTSVSGVTFWFAIRTVTENGLPYGVVAGGSTPGLKMRGKMNTTVTNRIDIMRSSRKGPRRRDLGAGSLGDDDAGSGLTPPDLNI